MHNSRPQHAVYPGKLPLAVIKHSIDKGTAVMARRRMHHHPLWFIHYQHVLVLIKNGQRDILRLNGRFHRLRDLKGYFIIHAQTVICLAGNSIHKSLSFSDTLLNIGTGQVRNRIAQALVKPLLLPCPDLITKLFHIFLQSRENSSYSGSLVQTALNGTPDNASV